jgi:hypothetical protein
MAASSRAGTLWVAVTVGFAAADPWICGAAAAMVPTTTTAGAAFPAVWATFSTCEGVVCCPVRLIFRFLRCLGTELTRLLMPGSPDYWALLHCSPGRTGHSTGRMPAAEGRPQ